MAGKRITTDQKDKYFALRMKGNSVLTAANKAGFSKATGDGLERDKRNYLPSTEQDRMQLQRDPLTLPELSDEAKRSLNDFAYFQRRYFGRVPYMWQIEAAEKCVELLDSPHKEYLVVNCPPGVGKTTLFTHDIPAWLTVRNRQIRGMMGAATTSPRHPVHQPPAPDPDADPPRESSRRRHPAGGYAFDAEATLADDFGRFQADR